MLDEIQKRTNVKDYLTEGQTIVQHIHGDMIGSQVSVQDSVVTGSSLGGGVSGAGSAAGGSSGGSVNIQDSVVQNSQIGTPDLEEIPCPHCGGKISPSYDQCPWCGNSV